MLLAKAASNREEGEDNDNDEELQEEELIMRPSEGPGAHGMWSNYMGVTYDKRRSVWLATGVKGHVKGGFATERDAAVAYTKKTREARNRAGGLEKERGHRETEGALRNDIGLSGNGGGVEKLRGPQQIDRSSGNKGTLGNGGGPEKKRGHWEMEGVLKNRGGFGNGGGVGK